MTSDIPSKNKVALDSDLNLFREENEIHCFSKISDPEQIYDEKMNLVLCSDRLYFRKKHVGCPKRLQQFIDQVIVQQGADISCYKEWMDVFETIKQKEAFLKDYSEKLIDVGYLLTLNSLLPDLWKVVYEFYKPPLFCSFIW